MVRVLSYNIRSMRDDTRGAGPGHPGLRPRPRPASRRHRASSAGARPPRGSPCDRPRRASPAAPPPPGPMILPRCGRRWSASRTCCCRARPGLHQRGFATAVLRFGGARLSRAQLPPQPQRRPSATSRPACCWTGSRRWASRTPWSAATSTTTPTAARFGRLAADAPGRLGGAPVGRRVHLARPATRSSASTRSSPTAGIEVLGCGVPAGLPGVTDAGPARAPPTTCRCWPPLRVAGGRLDAAARPGAAAAAVRRQTTAPPSGQVVVVLAGPHARDQGGEAAEEAADAQHQRPPGDVLAGEHEERAAAAGRRAPRARRTWW